jgi:hypothetical protein
MVDWLVSVGFQARKVSFESWRMELFQQVARMPSDSWEPYLPLIEEVEEQQIFMPQFDHTHTLAGLSGSGIRCPAVDIDLLATYIEFFTRNGFLEKPRTATK